MATAPPRAAVAVAVALLDLAVATTGLAQTLSIIGTNDLHGRLFTDDAGRGGLDVLGGFVDNLRAARAADGGAVLVLDAGDTFQGGIESNLSEGLMVVDAYNAIGYAALAIGNHDFDYGSVDPRGPVAQWLPEQVRGRDPGDMQGALKAAAARARFPFLTANIVDDTAGTPVAWPNVAPSTLVTAAGIRVGIIGAMTETGLRQTLAAHVVGLVTTPLVTSIEREARALRERGAEVVVLVTHAGGWCNETQDPRDLSSCDAGAEIFRVARELPPGTLQAIVAGHTHGTVAHFVADVPIVSVPNFGVAFGRIDLSIDAATRRVTDARIFEPRRICARVATGGDCALAPRGVPTDYEGRRVVPSARVAAAIAPELARVRALRAEPLGVVADTPVARSPGPESAIGNLVADAVRATVPGADVALSYGFGRGGLRTDLPAGPITFGAVYDVFPFDNRVTRVTLTGDELARVLAAQLPQAGSDARRGPPSLSGVSVSVACEHGAPALHLALDSGHEVQPNDELVVAVTSYSAGRTPWTVVEGERDLDAVELPLLVRDAVGAWLLDHGGHVGAARFVDPMRPRWRLPAADASCGP